MGKEPKGISKDKPKDMVWHGKRLSQIQAEQHPVKSGNEPISLQDTKDKENKRRYLEERIVRVASGSSYSFLVEKIGEDYKYQSTCEKKSSNGNVEQIEHYVYVSKDKAKSLAAKLSKFPADEQIREGIKLIEDLRRDNYKGSDGVMIYISPRNKKIKQSPDSIGRPEVKPRYIPSGDKILETVVKSDEPIQAEKPIVKNEYGKNESKPKVEGTKEDSKPISGSDSGNMTARQRAMSIDLSKAFGAFSGQPEPASARKK